MARFSKSLLFFIALGIFSCVFAQGSTQRIPQIDNQNVNVWKTIIYPRAQAKLNMHRHEHDRVLVALTDGLLKVTNDKGKTHYLKLQKGKSYYLKKDPQHELHVDVNETNHPISVIVVELKKG